VFQSLVELFPGGAVPLTAEAVIVPAAAVLYLVVILWPGGAIYLPDGAEPVPDGLFMYSV
jgi:hypothetical protein